MATIRKRNGRWQVQVKRKGHKAVGRSFRRKADALIWSRQVEGQADRRELPADPRALERITLGEILVRYRDTVVVRKRSRVVETFILNALLRTSMAGLSLAQLTPKHIADYREARHSAVKPVTINRELGLVQHAIDMARREWNVPLNDNPVKQVHKPRQDQLRERRLRTGELDRLVAACGSCRNGYVAPLIRLAIETGMRQGELLRLTWADLDFVRRTLLIRIAKNGHPRTIPMSSAAIECVGELQKLGGFANALIFPTTASALKQSWRRLTKRAGLEDLHFHDLRHEAISRFFEKGLSLPEVALISGHRDPRMLFRYTHPQPELIAPKLQ